MEKVKPLYDINKSYLENAEEGPFFSGPLPKREMPEESTWVDFLGFKVASPLGVPAGPLLNARWIETGVKLGFDIVTYKTIRSREHPAHPLPNMVYVKADHFLSAAEEGESLEVASNPPRSMEELALTNSFGIPSRDLAYLTQDIARARSALQSGQVLIVSVVGTPRPGEDFFDDFIQAARIACDNGAMVLEADLSCPNLATSGGQLYLDSEAVGAIALRFQKAFPHMPAIMKLGMISDKAILRKVLIAMARGGARAVCGINTLSMRVVDAHGQAALGSQRLKAGVCGKPIRQAALQFTTLAREVIDEEKLDLCLMTTGGVTEFSHFDLFFHSGADVAMSGVGMMWDPFLAMKYHQFGMHPWIKK